jgi:hypothetical protein
MSSAVVIAGDVSAVTGIIIANIITLHMPTIGETAAKSKGFEEITFILKVLLRN